MVLTLSAVGFAVAANVERAREGEGISGLNAPEGSAAREGAERASVTTTPSTRGSSTSASTSTPPTSENPLSAPEGSPAREAAERAGRHGTTTTTALAPPTSGSSQPVTSTTEAVAPASSTLPPPRPSEALFGINTESTATTAIAVALLVAAAVVAIGARKRWPLLGVAALTGLFALLDAREAWHQHHEARPGLVAAAVALALTHAVASGLSIAATRPKKGSTDVVVG